MTRHWLATEHSLVGFGSTDRFGRPTPVVSSQGFRLFQNARCGGGAALEAPDGKPHEIGGFLFEVRPRHTTLSLLQIEQSKSPGVVWRRVVPATRIGYDICPARLGTDIQVFRLAEWPIFAGS
jgi:hypothetical protein